jgi:hypothetical protein
VTDPLADATGGEVDFSGDGAALFFMRLHRRAPGPDLDQPRGGAPVPASAAGWRHPAPKITCTGEMPPCWSGLRQPAGAEDVQDRGPDPDSLGTPKVVSVALVQVNDFGEYAINSWVTNS